MLTNSTTTKSRSNSKNRTQKYTQRQSVPNSSQVSTLLSTIKECKDTPPIHVHQHQHTHNYYIYHTFKQLQAYSCTFKKILICALIFFVVYYLLFLILSKSDKHMHKQAHNAMATVIIETPKNSDVDIQDIIDGIEHNRDSIHSIETETDSPQLQTNPITEKVETDTKSHREKFLERKRIRRDQRKARLAKLRGEKPEMPEISGKKSEEIKTDMHRNKKEELPKFPDLYISDNPYYLDSNIVIIGQLSNADTHLKDILRQLLSISCLYNSTTFILYESNSEDETREYLHEFRDKSSVNCIQSQFNPLHSQKYGNIKRTLEELINIFDSSLVHLDNNEYDMINDLSVFDDLIYDTLTNYTSLDDIDLREIESFVSEQIRIEFAQKWSDIEIEEIIFDKLSVIKYVKYYDKIRDKTENSLNKYVIFGDEFVENEWFKSEMNILNLIRLRDGVNEFHMDMNGGNSESNRRYNELSQVRFKQGTIHKMSDFESEFGDIHSELEGLIANDEDIIHERLRERQLRFKRKRAELKTEKEQMDSERDLKNHKMEQQRFDEYYSRFRDRLYRIERFVIYRNMLLREISAKSEELHIGFEHVMIVDMDIYNIDVRTFLNELYYSPAQVKAMCIDGIDREGYTRDTFATVTSNGAWLHYGHDSAANDTYYIYKNEHALAQRKLIPNEMENNRFAEVKSCFGGLIVYKNGNDLFESECRYTLTRDIFYTTYNETDLQKYSYEWWLSNRYHNKYSQESKLELQLFREQYIEILQVEDKRIWDRQHWPKDGDICEHIPFHYCLNDYGWKFAIASRAKLYYDQLFPTDRKKDGRWNDVNWPYYFENRPRFTHN